MPGLFGHLQLLAVSLIGLQWDLAQVLEQLAFTFGCEEHLVMPKAIEVSSRLAPTDTPLVTPDLVEESLQLQIVRRQAGDIITRQQVLPIAAPQNLQATAQDTLRSLAFAIWLEPFEQLVHCLGDLLSSDWLVRIAAWGIAQTGCDFGQTIMGLQQLVRQGAVLFQGALHLLSQLLPILVLGLGAAQCLQSCGQRLQLLVALQPAPLERLATAAVKCISNSCPKLSR